MMSRRRLTLQLTPLLDLLLIVIFAQYMEMQEQVRLRETLHAGQLAEVRAESDALRSERSRIKDEAQSLKIELAAAWNAADRMAMQEEAAKEQLERARRERDSVASLYPEMFQLKPDTAKRLLNLRAQESPALTDDQVQKLQDDFKELAEQSPEEAVRHLLTYEEIRKRCDVWDVYVARNGMISFKAGNHTVRFRAETSDAVERELFDAYQKLPQPRTLVIVLLSHGDVKAGIFEAALQGLPRVIERMRVDQTGRTRFEYGVLGFREARSDEEQP